MKERPILFSAPMVRAILDGRKTQTRRVMRVYEHPAVADYVIDSEGRAAARAHSEEVATQFVSTFPHARVLCRFGKIGDRLWVKEAWKYADWSEDGEPVIQYRAGGKSYPEVPDDWQEKVIDIWADLSDPANREIDGLSADRKWRPSLFMPCWASRITLEITNVRVERLNEIGMGDAVAEGISCVDYKWGLAETGFSHNAPEHAYRMLWDSLNAKGHSWSSNPWVWVVEFKQIKEASDGK